MKFKDLLDDLADAFKVPETKEEAIAWINKDANSQTLIEEMAFRQVVVNILVAAGIITENDFNASVAHFKKLFTEKFAEEMLAKIDDFNQKYNNNFENEELDSEHDYEDEFDDWGGPIGKA